jgi:hypothetical protein
MRGKRYVFDDFSGGINLTDDPAGLPSNESPNLLDVIAADDGALQIRNDDLLYTPSCLVSPTSIIALSPTLLLYASGSTFATVVPSTLVHTSVATGLGGTQWEFEYAAVSGGQGPIYALSGTATPKYVTTTGTVGTWTASAGAIPAGSYMVWHANRMWVAGVAANPSRLYWSNIGDPRDWPVANVVDLDPNDDDIITGMAAVGRFLIVFKERSFFVITDNNTGANQRIAKGVGCLSHRSIASTANGVLFLANDHHVYETDGFNLTSTRIARKIHGELVQVDDAVLRTAAAAIHRGSYYLTYADTFAGTSYITWQYDMTTGSWWRHRDGGLQLVPWNDNGTENVLLCIFGTSITAMFRVPNGARTSKSSYWRSPILTFGDPAVNKRCREIVVMGSGTNFAVRYGKDYAAPSALTEESIGLGATIVAGRVPTLGVARAWQFEVRTDGSAWVLESVTMSMQKRSD